MHTRQTNTSKIPYETLPILV